MTNEMYRIKRGIKARLETIPGLRAITFEPEEWSDFPLAVIKTGRRSAPRVGVNGSRVVTDLVATVVAGGSKSRDAYDALDSYIAPSGKMSVEAAIAGDRTLGGYVERARLIGVENVRIVRMGRGRYVGADFRIRVEKRIGRAAVLELRDGLEIVELLKAPYFADADARLSPVERDASGRFAPRRVEIALWMEDSGGSRIWDGLGALDSICARAESSRGSQVRLRRGYGDSFVEYRVLRGGVEALPESKADGQGLSVKLSLSVDALGRLPSVEMSDTLYNERHGGRSNYAELTSIPGSYGAPAQIRIHDPSGTWSGARRMWIGKRSGARRLDNLFFQGEDGETARGSGIFDNSPGIWSGGELALSEASGGKCAQMEWSRAGRYTTTSAFTLCGHVGISIAARDIPRGRFRALARVRTETKNPDLRTGHMGFALGWSFGTEFRIPAESDVVFPPAASEFRTLDLGELTLLPTPVPDDFPVPEFKLNVYGAFRGGGAGSNRGLHRFRWLVDCVSLLPIDEGEVTVNGVGPSERILLDTSSELGGGVYVMDETDTLLGVGDAEGVPFTVGPENVGIYIARDDDSDPSGVKFGVRTVMTPLVAGV